MKNPINNWALRTTLALATAAWCGPAHADLSVTNSAATNSWNTVGGQNPFYTTITTANLPSAVTSQGQPGAGAGASHTVLSELLTITNGAGSLAIGNTNYVLTGLAIMGGGGGANISVHLYEVTTNLTAASGSPLTNSGAGYTFVANGDLLGNGGGLTYSNSLPGKQQVYFSLSSGPNTQDQIVLGANRTYALEFWTPAATGGGFTWYRFPTGSPSDPGGQGMAINDARLTVPRKTINGAGLAGGAPRTLALALYGTPTSAAPKVNGTTNVVATTNYFVDAFNPAGYGPTNSYVGTNNYANGDLTNMWGNWFGDAFQSVEWDATSDGNGNPNSGSLKLTVNFGTQFVLRDLNGTNSADNNAGIKPPLRGLDLGLTRFECDVRFDPSSAITVNGSTTNYGHLSIGTRGGDFGQHYFGSVEVPRGQTNWVHVSIPINPGSDTNLINIPNVLFNIYGPYYSPNLSGQTILWLDNIKFVGPATVVAPPPPTLSIVKATPALRIFAGDTSTISREQIATVDQNASWVGGTYPVSYSFTLKNLPAGGSQFHMFLIPTASLPANYNGNPYGNSFVDYDARNDLWLLIQGGAAQVAWKTNLTASNPNNIVATLTPASVVGTWTLTFNSATSGTLTAPDTTFVNFILPANVAAEFANPLVAYFGLQPNSSAGIGQYIDVSRISITNTAGTPISEDFTMSAGLDSGTWTNVSGYKPSVVLISTNAAYWVRWTGADFGFGLGTKADLGDLSTPWYRPDYWNGYSAYPATALMGGVIKWSLINQDNLPTTDGQPFGPVSGQGFFLLSNPPPFN